ncbi:MAG: peptidase M35 [Candidatus Aminicenantes bacterium]|nr:peptidase M35 [Candidatus Aminicenantes bacterium]NIM81110.1 peptidase M35 [Candidatus Aminicenantes bacterium]NIN20484.1 peptidase M35 [Candidatus Aminicenantes bacterium]NIN44257.1 peptidase M35 [Candidatus Aminicenantes bacterium]NIN87076.1 peptidase M35 [Candidatus Aminicenantes bacterium]
MRHKPIVRFFLVIIGITALIVMPRFLAQAEDVEELTCSLQAERAEYGAAEAIILRFTLTNNSDKTLNVLKWRTPLEGFNADIFLVEIEGKRVIYIGRLVKRGAPPPEDYVSLAPGKSVSSVVDIGKGYAVYDAGDYSVQFKSSLLDFGYEDPARLSAKRTLKRKAIQSNTVSFKLLEKKEPPAPPAPRVTDVAEKQPVFIGCSQTQRDTLNSALVEAREYASGALIALQGTSVSDRPNATRYTTWFGVYSSSRYNTIINNFDKIHDALSNETITFNCDCNENYYAYVYPNDPYKIYLCNLFWSAPLVGTDSKMGTIIHEISHFYVVTGTKDHAYGHANCKNLANTDPSKAIQNADSHEYFAENTPPLSMGLELIAYSLLAILLLVLMYRVIHNRRRKAA